jgi:hypothetical protein
MAFLDKPVSWTERGKPVVSARLKTSGRQHCCRGQQAEHLTLAATPESLFAAASAMYRFGVLDVIDDSRPISPQSQARS